jgi:H+/Cl- antiporter ClcA
MRHIPTSIIFFVRLLGQQFSKIHHRTARPNATREIQTKMGKVARSLSSSSPSLLLLLLTLLLVFHVCYGFQPPQRRHRQDRRGFPEAKRKNVRFFLTAATNSSSRSRLYLSNKTPVKEKKANVVVKSKGKEAVNGASSSSSVGTSSSSQSSQSWPQIELPYYLQSEAYHLIPPALVGVSVGVAVAIFKLSVEGLRDFSYGNYPLPSNPELLLLIPTFGGLLVGFIRMLGVLPPGLRETIEQVDEQNADRLPIGDFWQKQADFFRKSFSSVLTLRTGNSLGPEGPSVELGVNVAKVVLQLVPDRPTSTGAFPMEQKRRFLLLCGAAAGVSAGFNAPIASVFFALEIVQGAFQFLDTKNAKLTEYSATAPGTFCAVLLSSVLSALVSREILGSTMVLKVSNYALNTPALELPIFLFLGVLSGITAFAFYRAANFSHYCFNKGIFKDVPRVFKPALGGLFCGTVGLVFPQVLFFGTFDL